MNLNPKHNRTGTIEPDPERPGEFLLMTPSGKSASPISEGDYLELNRETFRVERKEGPESPLGFRLKGELTSCFQPLSGLKGKSARRDEGHSHVGKITGSH